MDEHIAGTVNNPWWRIWVQPRPTIREIVDTDPKMNFWMLVVFYGLTRAVDWAMQVGLGDILPPSGVATFLLIGGPLAGAAGVYLTAGLLGLVSRMLGGEAEGAQIRTVLVWAAIPMNVLAILGMLPLILLFKADVFTNADPQLRAMLTGQNLPPNFLHQGLMLWKAFCDLGGAIYYMILTVVGLSEVSKFNAWRALGAFVLVMGLLFSAFICLTLTGGSPF